MKKDKITEADLQNFQKKFEKYDWFKSQGMPYLGYHLDDPSLWAYEFFSNPMDKTKPFLPQPFQDLILNDKNKGILAVLCRQVGKSITVAIKALHTAYFKKGSTIVIISATKEQATELIWKMKQFLLNSQKKINFRLLMPTAKDKKTEIYLNRGSSKEPLISRIISLPATDAARGYTADLAIIDEAAFLEHPKGGDYVFHQIVRPMVLRTKGDIMITTTPNGAQGFVYELFNSDHWSVYHFDWRVCSDYTEESIRRIRLETDPLKFGAEYEAKFLAPQSAYFNYKKIRVAVKEDMCGAPTERALICGVDFGKVNDACVIMLGYIINPEAEENQRIVRLWKRIVKPLGTDYGQLLDELRDIKRIYNPANFLIDATGVGTGPADMMQREGFNFEGIIFSQRKKIDLFANLSILFDSGRIEIPNEKELIDQLTLFEYDYDKFGKGIRLHAPQGGHDDECDALALMCWGLTLNQKSYGGSYIISSGKEEKKGAVFGYCNECDEYRDFIDNLCPICNHSLYINKVNG